MSSQKCLCNRVVDILIRAQPGNMEHTETGQIVGRVIQDASAVTQWMIMILSTFCLPVFIIVSCSSMLWYLEPQFLVFASLIFVMPTLITQLARKPVERNMLRVQQDSANVLHRVTDFLTGLAEMRKSMRSESFLQALSTDYLTYKRSMLKVAVATSLTSGCSNASAACIVVCMMIYGGILIGRGQTTLGALIGSVSLVTQISGAIQTLASARLSSFQVAASCKRLMDILRVPVMTEIDALESLNENSSQRPVLTVENLCVRKDDREILHDLSFSLEAGTTFHLIGKNGSGKSTACGSIAGAEVVAGGLIKIMGIPLSEFGRTRLRRTVTLLSPTPHIFTGSLLFNLTCWIGDANTRDFEIACKIAGVDDILRRLPEGLETKIGSGGLQLSRGEQAQVAIARALLLKPDLIIFDETLTGLADPLACSLLERMREQYPGITVLIAAHHVPDEIVIDRWHHINDKTAGFRSAGNRPWTNQHRDLDLMQKKGLTCMYGIPYI